MKILAWNCRGLALAPTIRVLRALICSHRPDLLFLSETKVSSSRYPFLLHGFGFVDMLEVPLVGSRGGIFLTWKEGVDLEPVKLDSHSISYLVLSEPLSTPWMFSSVYAPHLILERSDFWIRMSELGNSFGGVWLLMGDFNSVLSSSEKSGGRSVGSPSHLEFLDFVHSNALVDLGFVGNRYTWSNHRCGRDNIRERLDRGLANQDWIQIFPNSLLNHFLLLNLIIALFCCRLLVLIGICLSLSVLKPSGLGICPIFGLWLMLGLFLWWVLQLFL
jgi:hypothetical protein